MKVETWGRMFRLRANCYSMKGFWGRGAIQCLWRDNQACRTTDRLGETRTRLHYLKAQRYNFRAQQEADNGWIIGLHMYTHQNT